MLDYMLVDLGYSLGGAPQPADGLGGALENAMSPTSNNQMDSMGIGGGWVGIQKTKTNGLNTKCTLTFLGWTHPS